MDGSVNVRPVLVPLAAAALLVGIASPALAYLSGAGSGTTGAAVGTLAAPTDVTAVAADAEVTVTWSASATPDTGSIGYVVTRTPVAGGPAVAACGPDPVMGTSCDDEDVAPGTYTYSVTATLGGWSTAAVPSAPVVVGGGPTTTTLVLSPSTATYGAEDSTAFDVEVDTTDGGTATGMIDVSTASGDLCTITLPDSSCSPGPDALAPADSPYPVIATYLGDWTYAGSVSAEQLLTVYDAPTITTTALASALDGETGYSQALSATGGLPDLTWSVTSGDPPERTRASTPPPASISGHFGGRGLEYLLHRHGDGRRRSDGQCPAHPDRVRPEDPAGHDPDHGQRHVGRRHTDAPYRLR